MSDGDPVISSENLTSIGLHSVKNLLGNEQQLSLFSQHQVDSFAKTYKIELKGKIDRFGIDLTDFQLKVMEGILKGFSMTGYRGNINPKATTEVLEEKFAFGDAPSIYNNVLEIPCLRATQAEILRWSGISQKSFGEKETAIESLKVLGTKQYCFYYSRLALDNKGSPQKSESGAWEKESVIAVDTLFTIKEVRDDQTDVLKFYEIIPSPIFLDQRESYCMLIPYNWREEVRKIVGNKKASSYTFRFILFLMYQYELKRRSKKGEEKSYSIKWSWEEIAIAIKMPESVYKRNKQRALKILEGVYDVAQQLGYLKEYIRGATVDCLMLNEEKYYPSSRQKNQLSVVNKIEKQKLIFSAEAEELYDFFHQEKMAKDPQHFLPKGMIKINQLKIFEDILKSRLQEDVKKLINWGLSLSYWCSQLGSPAKLRKNFGEAWIEMENSSTSKKDLKSQSNRKIAEEFISSNKYLSQSNTKIELFNSYLEIQNGIHVVSISYQEKGFKDIFESALRKRSLL